MRIQHHSVKPETLAKHMVGDLRAFMIYINKLDELLLSKGRLFLGIVEGRDTLHDFLFRFLDPDPA